MKRARRKTLLEVLARLQAKRKVHSEEDGRVGLKESFKEVYLLAGYSEAEAQRLAAAAVPEEGKVTAVKEKTDGTQRNATSRS